MAPNAGEPRSWFEHYVVHRLDELTEQLSCTSKKLDTARLEIAGLKVRASLWGLLAGTIPAIGALLLLLIRNRL